MARMSAYDKQALAAAQAYADWLDQQEQAQTKSPPATAEERTLTHAKAAEMWQAFYRPLVNDPVLADKNITLIADMFYGLNIKTVLKEFRRIRTDSGAVAVIELFHACELALLDADAYTNPSRDLIGENIIDFMPRKVKDRLNDAYNRYGSDSSMVVGMNAIDMTYNIWLAVDPTYHRDWFESLYPGCLAEILAKFPLVEIAGLLGGFMHEHGAYAPAVSHA